MVLYGATTGRDGIGGVSVLASATIEEGSEESRPSVQIGDPFAEKLLIEASLELVDEDLLEGLQDLGGAGLTCAVSESAARAGLGARLDLDEVPLREPGMEAFEILTSESQERMLAIVHPSKLERVRAVCAKWGLATAVVATLEAGGDLDVQMAGEPVARVPALSLTEKAPVYDRPMQPIPSDHDDPTFAPVRWRSRRGAPLAPRRAQRRVQAVGLRAVRPDGPGPDRRGAGVRCRRRPGAGDDEGSRPVGRRQRSIRDAGSVPRRRARRRRGRPGTSR